MQVQSTIGIDNLKMFVVRAIQASDLDKNRDGKVSPAEIAGSLASLAGSVFSISDIVKRARDLQPEEIADLLATVSAYLPNYQGVDDKIENLVRAILNFLSSMTVSFVAVLDAMKALKEANNEGQTAAFAPAESSTTSKAKGGRPKKEVEEVDEVA